MKKWNGFLRIIPASAKWMVGLFVIVLSIGFYSGIRFVEHTTDFNPQGVEEQYIGNEDDEEAEELKYEKTTQEMFTTMHTHFMSLAMVFFLTGILTLLTKADKNMKRFLAIEPLISVIVTFGGLILMWKGVLWMKYIVILSGVLMTLCYTGCVLLILWDLTQKSEIHKA